MMVQPKTKVLQNTAKRMKTTVIKERLPRNVGKLATNATRKCPNLNVKTRHLDFARKTKVNVTRNQSKRNARRCANFAKCLIQYSKHQ